MIAGVADTHAVIWYLSSDKRLSVNARTFIEAAGRNNEEIAISAITFVEIIYLIERSRIPAESLSLLARELATDTTTLVEVALTLPVARTLSQINAAQIPDMPDRIIAATALYLNVPIISRDGKIRLSGLTTIW